MAAQPGTISRAVFAGGSGVTPGGPSAASAVNVYNALTYGAAGNGLTDDRDVLHSLANTTLQAVGGGTLYLPPGSYVIGDGKNLTIPENVTLWVSQGARFVSVDFGTATLTINGHLIAPLYRIFNAAVGGGTVTVTFGPGRNRVVYPQWWGAEGRGTATNDLTAIQRALASIASIRGVVELPLGEYRVDATTGPISIPLGCTLRGSGWSRYAATTINHVGGAVLFDLSDGYEPTHLDTLVVTGGVAGAVGIRVRRPDARVQRIGFEAWTGESCIELDNNVGATTGPWLTHIRDLDIRCWSGVWPGGGSIDYGVRAKAEWNGASLSDFTINGAAIAGVAVEGGTSWEIRNGSTENNIDGSDGAVGVLIGGNPAKTPVAGKVSVLYSERNDGAQVRVKRCRCLELNSIMGDGLTGSLDGDTQVGIDIADASGTGADVQKVTISGATDLQRHAIADVRITGTKSVQINDRPHMGSATDIVTGAGGGYIRPEAIYTGDVAVDGTFVLSTAKLGAQAGLLTIVADNNWTAQIVLRGSDFDVAGLVAIYGSFSMAAGTAANINIYYSGGYRLQNKTAATRQFKLSFQPFLAVE